MKHRTTRVALAALLLSGPLHAAPPLINYQGRIVVGSTNFEGTGQFKFALVDGGVNQNVTATATIPAAGGSIFFIAVTNGGSGYVTAPAVTITDSTGTGATAVATLTNGAVTGIQVTNGGSGYSFQPTVTIAPPPPNIHYTGFWKNDGSGIGNVAEPTAAVALQVSKGLYSVLLGDTTIPNMASVPAGLSSVPDLRLRVWFDDGVNGSQLLSPDQRLAPAAYLAAGAVTSTTISDGAVTSSKIAPDSITGTQLAPGAVDATRLATPGSPSPGQVLGYNAGSLAWIASGGGTFSLNGTNAYYNGGNVGIGTTSPSAKLDVRGGVTIETGGNASIFTGTGTAELNRYLTLGNSPGFQSASGFKAGGVLVASDYAYANPGKSDLIVQGKAAIGTAAFAPSTKLTIQTTPGLSVSKWGLEHTDGTVRLATHVDDVSAGLRMRSAHRMILGGYDGGGLSIDTAGRVGIGTVTPNANLAVESTGGNVPVSVHADWAPSGIPNVQLTGSRPTLLWNNFGSGIVSRSWIAQLGSTDGLEFWTRSQTIFPPSDSGWQSRVTLTTDGDINYAGKLGKLDTTEQFASTVRTADFLLGHSTRRGTPGRALVDWKDAANKKILVVNWANDWDETHIEGAVTQVKTLRITGGADLAEPFQMKEEELEKGTVVVIDDEHPGRLKRSAGAYDTRVAGIISGANGVNPGIALHQEGMIEGGQNVALSGRVYVQADATGAAIKPGDLLTTSDAPGRAMKVTEPSRAQGAVIGKAMSSLAEGTGLVLVLVSLQ